jgi:hypothetical protein
MQDLAIFILSLVVVTALSGLALQRHVMYRKSIERIVQLEIDKLAISKHLLDAHQELEDYRLGETEEFVKFLSTSRQWAFDFIEEYQTSLKELFALLNDPNHNAEQAVAKFQELKKFLPKED